MNRKEFFRVAQRIRVAAGISITSYVYRWRAECDLDTRRMLALLPPRELLEFQSIREDPFPDKVNQMTVATLQLDEVRAIMRQVPDGHVMVQTVQLKNRYTGKRDYTI